MPQSFEIDTWHQLLLSGHILLSPQVCAQVQARLHPLGTEVKTKGDGEVPVINAKNIGDLKT